MDEQSQHHDEFNTSQSLNADEVFDFEEQKSNQSTPTPTDIDDTILRTRVDAEKILANEPRSHPRYDLMHYRTNKRYYSRLGATYAGQTIGSLHVRKGMVCEDAYAIDVENFDNGETISLLAIADGHGSEKSDQSEHGALIAVNVAIKLMKKLFTQTWSDAQKLNIPDAQKNAYVTHQLSHAFREHLPRRVVRSWCTSVRHDALERELVTDTQLENKEEQRLLYQRYGTTLAIALITPHIILYGRIGDADIIFVDSEGEVECPTNNRSQTLVGNETHSLSQEGAWYFWVTGQKKFPNQPLLLVMSTDGLSNSFADDEQFGQFSASLFEQLRQNGLEKIAGGLPQLFWDYSSRGSGDDITLALQWFFPQQISQSFQF